MTDSSMCEIFQHMFDEAIKLDTWGQRIEAAEEYKKFKNEFDDFQRQPLDENTERKIVNILKNVKRRAVILDNASEEENVTLHQLQNDFKEFCTIFLVTRPKRTVRRESSVMVIDLCAKNALLPPCINKQKGGTYLVIKIEKIGLKDAITYVDPLFTVSFKDEHGRDIMPMQTTKPSENIQAKCIVFNTDIHLPKSLEELPSDYAIFFEFKHFKEKKQKVSTRCFSFLEKDEINNGVKTLELYKKPVDYGRKKLYLLTEKSLFLHLFLFLTKA